MVACLSAVSARHHPLTCTDGFQTWRRTVDVPHLQENIGVARTTFAIHWIGFCHKREVHHTTCRVAMVATAPYAAALLDLHGEILGALWPLPPDTSDVAGQR